MTESGRDQLLLDLPFAQVARRLLFRLVSKPYETTSIAVIGNLALWERPSVFSDAKATTAPFDHPVPRCGIVESGNDGCRSKSRSGAPP